MNAQDSVVVSEARCALERADALCDELGGMECQKPTDPEDPRCDCLPCEARRTQVDVRDALRQLAGRGL